MKKAIRICLCFWMGFSAGAWGQTVYYVNSKASVSNTGGTQTAPFNTVHKALNQAHAGDTIKVAVGLYPISTDRNKGGEGSIVVGAGITVRGGYASTPQGGVASAFADNPQDSVNQTIFMGDSTCRIATVAGTLEKVTLRGGKAIGGNGGGAYVKGSGELRNCIVRDCIATPKVIKVGDLYLKNGEVVDVHEYKYNRDGNTERDVVGVVFWVNPDKAAPEGERARIMSLPEIDMGDVATLSDGCEAEYPLGMFIEGDDDRIGEMWKLLSSDNKKQKEEAMVDYDGRGNTSRLLQNYVNGRCTLKFEMAAVCRAYGDDFGENGVWYQPSYGEVMMMQANWSVVDDSYSILWGEIIGNTGTRRKGNFCRYFQKIVGFDEDDASGWNGDGNYYEMMLLMAADSYALWSSTMGTENDRGFWISNFYEPLIQTKSIFRARNQVNSTFAVRML